MPAEHMTERGWDAGWKRASFKTTLLCQIGFFSNCSGIAIVHFKMHLMHVLYSQTPSISTSVGSTITPTIMWGELPPPTIIV